ncbi:hypothetical protein IMCC9480_2610 [Oxalobacteraceae bacterium IMCC9480]|nr:hypothetical protein IMCC9480_2610 [Oxalobacteraceae bacterium IMCC9480]
MHAKIQRIAFAATICIEPLVYLGTSGPRNLRSTIAAIVSNYQQAVPRL